MESKDVRPELINGLQREMRFRPVEHCHSVTVSARRVRSDGAVPSQPVGVDYISYLGLLKDAQVHVGLGNPPQRRLQSPVSFVPGVIGSKPNWHPPPHRIPGTPTHPPPTDVFSSPDPCALPARTCLPLLPFLVLFRPHRPYLSIPVSVLVPVIPSPPTTLRSPRRGVLHIALTPGQVALRRGYRG